VLTEIRLILHIEEVLKPLALTERRHQGLLLITTDKSSSGPGDIGLDGDSRYS
jgi:hypothetical protein